MIETFGKQTALTHIVFVMAVLLTLAFWIIRYFSIRNAVHVTLILTIILFCWGISNILSFNVSTKVMEIGFLMGANRVSEIGNDGSPELYIQKIQRTIKFSSELNFIIDEYKAEFLKYLHIHRDEVAENPAAFTPWEVAKKLANQVNSSEHATQANSTADQSPLLRNHMTL